MKLRFAVAALALLALGSPSREAAAALTSSERAQVKDFVSAARPETAGRVRALVARTDLTEAESFAVMSDALAALPFDRARARFVREIVFGPSSAPSRPLLVSATVRGLVARADAIYQRHAGGLEREPRAVGELVGIYAFLDGDIANAGRAGLAGHDPDAGIPPATYEDGSKVMREHVERNARWLKGDGPLAEPVARVRAQAQVALVDMLPDGVMRRVDAADRLGLRGPRRQMMLDWGLLFADAKKLDEARLERVRRALARLPAARKDVSVLYAGAARGPLSARAAVHFVGGAAAPGHGSPFGDELTSAPYDAELGGVLLDVATVVARRVFDDKPLLRDRVVRDAVAAATEGRFLGAPRAPSAEHVLGAALHAVLLDAPRAVDLAMVRLLDGKPESAALLSDALGVLAAQAGVAPVEVGGGSGVVSLSGIRVAENGAALGFALEGASWSIDRAADSFAVVGARRGGQPVSLLQLSTAKTPMRDGDRWVDGDLSIARVRGAPRVGIVPAADRAQGPTIKLSGTSAKGYDVVAMTPPADDVVLDADLTVRGGPAGVALRLTSGRESIRGAVLLVTPGARTALYALDGAGMEALLAAPREPGVETPVHVTVTVRGPKIEAIVGETTLRGTLPAPLAKGDVGLVATKGASLEVAGWSVKRVGAVETRKGAAK